MNIKNTIEVKKRVHLAVGEINKAAQYIKVISLGLNIKEYIEQLKDIAGTIAANDCLQLIEEEMYANTNSLGDIQGIKQLLYNNWNGFFCNNYEEEVNPMGALTDNSHPWYAPIKDAIGKRIIDKQSAIILISTIELICKNLDVLKYGIHQLCSIPEEQGVNDVNKTKRTMKVTTDVLIELLDKAGVNENNSDKTKIAKLIAYITGFSENTIRQRMTNQEELTLSHKDEVERINKLFSELCIETSIKYNKNR